MGVGKGWFFFARSCLGKVPGGTPFSQRSERATACTIRMQIDKQIDVQDESRQIKQDKSNYELRIREGCRKERTSQGTSDIVDGSAGKKGGTEANDTKNRRGVMGYIPGTRWHKAECKVGLVEVSLSVYS